jgi:glycosyltransferase involved in cell wall biosynthesis
VSSRSRIVRIAARSVRAVGGALRAAGARVGGVPTRGTLQVSYGHTRVPRRSDQAVGGIVKLQALEQVFPNSPRRFNLLYLVSSRLPEMPVKLARASLAKGAALVVNQNGVAYPAWHGDGWERTNAPMAALLPMASHVFYQSQFCKDTADRFLGVQPERWEILHNAVDTERFVPAAARPARPLTLLLGGTQYAQYRVDAAMRALAVLRRSVPDGRLLVAGVLRWPTARTPRADAALLARELGIESAVEFLGPYAQADAVRLYQRADILLHSKYNDPCPTVVIEALSCGLPVVYSASGGVPELVGTEAGVGVPAEQRWDRDIPPDADALAEGVLRVWRELPRFSSVARRRVVPRFDVRPWLARHAEVFERLTR